MFTSIATAMAMVAAPCFYSWYSLEIAEIIMDYAVKGEYHAHLDYNGDGWLSVVDAVSVLRRYHDNVTNGNTITFDSAEMDLIAEVNGFQYIYYEIDFVESDPCRMYEYTADNITRIHVYYETEEECSGFWAVMNPFEETISLN